MGAETSSHNNVYKLRRSVAKFSSRLPDILAEHRQATEEFRKQYLIWLDKRDKVIAELVALATEFDSYHHNFNVARVKGSSANIVGCAACAVGLALAPFTGALSAAFSVGGVISSTAGNVATVGARTLEYAFEKKALEKARALVEEDCQETLHLSCLIGLCLKKKNEIESVVHRMDWRTLITENETIFCDVLKNATLKDRVARIRNGRETAEDCFVIVALLFNDFSLLNQLYSQQSALELKIMNGTMALTTSIARSASSAKRCVELINNWKRGRMSALADGSKFFGKRALMALNILFDLYDIGAAANEIERGIQSEGARNLRRFVREFEKQKTDISNCCDVFLGGGISKKVL